jgi:polyhydroxybutyrate depolymerase
MQVLHSKISFVFLIMLLVNCSSSDEQEPLHYHGTLVVDGLERTYLVNVPRDYETSGPVPLVLVLHGTGGQASQSERDYGWSEKSNSENFIVAYPEGVQNTGRLKLRTWNAGRCCHYAMEENIDDVQFISKLIEALVSKYSIDEDRVFITGISNGGMFAYRLGCEISDRIAAIASVSGNFLTSTPCEPAQTIPLLHIHSTSDTKVPYQGGYGIGGYYFPPADSGVQIFVEHNGCSNPPIVEERSGYRYTQWTECDGNSSAETYLLSDGGHSWPGGLKSRPRSDEPSRAINATDVIWEFFKKHSRQ